MSLISIKYAGVVLAVIGLPGWVHAQSEPGDQPLSVIEWLAEPPGEAGLGALGLETPITESALAPTIAAAPLNDGGAGTGLISAATSGLPNTLWQGSTLPRLQAEMDALPPEALAPVAALRKRLLVAEADPPVGVTAAELLLWRVSTLRELGAANEAMALVEESAADLTPMIFEAYADLALITGQGEKACSLLRSVPSLSSDTSLRIFCLARGSDWGAAALALQGANALGDIDRPRARLLAAFLDPEIADPDTASDGIRDVTPLDFRLLNAIGTPVPTADLPRVYALADLNPEIGWKAKLEAAERLSRTGAVPASQLFALYMDRVPAASGGVWDRADAVQKLDRAIASGDASALAATLPATWAAMETANLTHQLAAMMSDRLDPTWELDEVAAGYRDALLLLSDRYEVASPQASPAIRAIAQGDASTVEANDLVTAELLAGFRLEASQAEIAQTSLGERILRALGDIEAARQGDRSGLTQAIGTLRALGLETTARQVALHLAILEP